MSDTSEEKNLPPSRTKLRKAREKGTVVTSKETLASVSTLLVLAYLFARREAIARDMRMLMAFQPDDRLTFMEQMADAGSTALWLGVQVVVPVVVMVIAVSVLLGMTIAGGPLFTAHPLIPDFNKLNPATGFKKIFGRRALMGFLMHLVRLTALLVVPGLVLWAHLGALISAPSCGLDCIGQAVIGMLVPLLVSVGAVLCMFMLFDYLVQRSEFMREQRMSITEMKRESKEQTGDPRLKGQMRSDRQSMVERPTGLAQATVVLHASPEIAIGLRYVEGDTPAPLVVVRARGDEAVSRLLQNARVSIVYQPDAVRLIAGVPVGDYVVDDEQVRMIAPYLRGS